MKSFEQNRFCLLACNYVFCFLRFVSITWIFIALSLPCSSLLHGFHGWRIPSFWEWLLGSHSSVYIEGFVEVEIPLKVELPFSASLHCHCLWFVLVLREFRFELVPFFGCNVFDTALSFLSLAMWSSSARIFMLFSSCYFPVATSRFLGAGCSSFFFVLFLHSFLEVVFHFSRRSTRFALDDLELTVVLLHFEDATTDPLSVSSDNGMSSLIEITTHTDMIGTSDNFLIFVIYHPEMSQWCLSTIFFHWAIALLNWIYADWAAVCECNLIVASVELPLVVSRSCIVFAPVIWTIHHLRHLWEPISPTDC